jgi:hypothetical protein
MNFAVDQFAATAYTAPPLTNASHHELLFMSQVLPDGPHTLTMTQNSQANGETNVIDLDYILYNTTATTGQTLFVDDADTLVQYSGAWSELSFEDYFQHTAHVSTVAGSAVSFTFQGNFVSLNGPIAYGPDGRGLNASVVIDGGQPSLLAPTHPTLAGNTTFNSPIFTSSGLASGTHNLVITTLDNDHPLYVDYFLFGDTSGAASSSTTPAPAPAGASAQAIAPPIGSTSRPSRAPNVAAIVGGVVGAVAVIAILLIGFLLWRHWRRRRREIETPPSRTVFTSPNARWQQRMSAASSVTTLAGRDDDDLPYSERKEPRYLSD